MKGLVITIDGPAASGKGTLSKKISKDLNIKLELAKEIQSLIKELYN